MRDIRPMGLFFLKIYVEQLQSFLYHPWKFKMSLFTHFDLDKMNIKKSQNHRYFETGSNVIKTKKLYQLFIIWYLKFSFKLNDVFSVRKKIIEKKKHYKNYMVFRWKRKTLITKILIDFCKILQIVCFILQFILQWRDHLTEAVSE